jgi:hypothetical protein
VIEYDTGKTTIFVPKFETMYQIWMVVLEIEDFKKIYEVEIKYVGDME